MAEHPQDWAEELDLDPELPEPAPEASAGSFSFAAGADAMGQRLDVYLTAQAAMGLSRSHLQRLIEDGRVQVNGKAEKARYRLQTGDRVQVEVPAPQPLAVHAEDLPLDVVYEDSDLLVVNKPRGMVVHPAAGNFTGTLVNALLHHCHDLSGINGVLRPGIVHRLDKDTTGLLVVAKNDAAHQSLAHQIKERQAHREYLAVVHGQPKAEAGTVNAPIGRHPVDRQRMAVEQRHGKHAMTHFQVRERYADPGRGPFALLTCRLETGRTHQIRVHMAYIGHPVACDTVYGSRRPAFDVAGQLLHARRLEFAHPRTGSHVDFEAPPPADFQAVLDHLGQFRV